MKIKLMIKNGILPEGCIRLDGCKNPVKKIVSDVLKLELLYFENDSKYLKTPTHYQHISDDDVKVIIRMLIAPGERAGIPTRVIKEAIEILSETLELQVDLEANARKNVHLINVKNGVYDINHQTLLPHDIKYEFDYILNFNYIPPDKRKLKAFDYYLDTSIGKANAPSVNITIGYALSSLTDVKKAVVVIGPPHSGKSKLLDIIDLAVGSDYVRTNPFHKIGAEQAVASYLGGVRVNLSRDVKLETIREDEGFKSVISCEPINGRLLYQNSRTVTPRVKCIAASNSVPRFKSPDEASLDRLLLIKIQGYHGELNHALPKQLSEEIDSICSEAVDTLKEFVKSNYDFKLSKESIELLEHEKAKLHTVESFLEDNYEEDEKGCVSSVSLYNHYLEWCRSNAFDATGKNSFYETVRNTCVVTYKKVPMGNSYVNGFWGIARKCHDDIHLHDETGYALNCHDITETEGSK